METHKKFLLEQKALKVYIFACGIGFTVYAGLLCFNIRHIVAEWLAMTIGYILLSGGVWMYKLCKLTWAFMVYGYVFRCCILIQKAGLFGEYLDVAHYVVFAIGVVLCLYFAFNFKKYV